MIFDFPIEKIEIKFKTTGSCVLKLTLNDQPIDLDDLIVIGKEKIQSDNLLVIKFSKDQGDDTESFAELEYFKINGGDYSNWFKEHNYTIDKQKHPNASFGIINNGYFGYAGTLELQFQDCVDPLKIAGWTIADKEFEYIKYPLREGIYREKNFETVSRDAKYMFTGSIAPANKEINKVIDDLKIADLRIPLKFDEDRKRIEDWINQSSRVHLQELNNFDHFTYSAGNLDSLTSFVLPNQIIFMPSKMYYYHGELLEDKKVVRLDPWEQPLPLYANVLFEYPSPWYSTEELNKKIKEAKDKKCKIALDLTWLPVATDMINLDLSGIDQIFFSMNKTWPIHDLRPAFRWSRNKINDKQTFESKWGNYAKVPPNVFLQLIDQFPFDYVYERYNKDTISLCETFDLDRTSVLWFCKHESITHDENEHISRYYYLDDFVCTRKLLEYKDKYFW